MYCNVCGNPIPDDARYCAKCGRAVAGPAGAAAGPARSRLAKHLPVLAAIWVVYSLLLVFGGGAALFVGSMWMHPFMFGWPLSHFLLPGLITSIGVLILAVGVAGIATGWGLWQREPWARIAALILAVLVLLRPLLGTALGIYTFWVLLPNDAAAEYARAGRVV